MDNSWLQFWNDRYREEAYAYGTAPNVFFRKQLDKIQPAGKMLLGAEGEGRNAVYAAQKGWEVSAFDISLEGQKKALQLAALNKVQLDYQVGELPQLAFDAAPFDAIALIYAHFPPPIKSHYHQLLDSHLRAGGHLLFEAFSTSHVAHRERNDKVGGPKDLDMLFSIDELKADFSNYDALILTEQTIELNEGTKHIGTGSVIRFVGRKRE
ncbi:MAG: class I SAM-dependent methyltransferase [Bacteroidota bacterium]